MSTSTDDSPSPTKPSRSLILLGTWLVLLALSAGAAPSIQAATGVPHELFSFVMLAPAFACFAALIFRRWLPTPWKPSPMSVVIRSAGVACAAVIVFLVILSLLTGKWPSMPDAGGAPVVIFILLQVVGVLAEEIGWRGFVQRCGEQLARPGVVSALAGFIFGATHLGYWSLGVVPVLTFAVTAALMSLTITTIFVGDLAQRMVAAVIVHLGVNLTIASLTTGDEPLATTPLALTAAGGMLVATLLIKAAHSRFAKQTTVAL